MRMFLNKKIIKKKTASSTDKLKKALKKIEIYLLRLWIIIKQNLIHLYYLRKRTLNIFFLATIILVAFVFFLIYRSQIERYLQIDNQGNITSSVSNFFIAIAASIFGILAITFTLSIFVIKQAADRHTPNLLSRLSKDRTSKLIYWTIAAISMIFFIFALLPLKKILVYELFLGFILIFFTFLLLRKQYSHITKIINPIQQLFFYHNRAIKSLIKIDKHLDKMIKIGAIKPGPIKDDESKEIEPNKNEIREQLRAGLIFRTPNLFLKTESELAEIYSLIFTYIPRKDYKVLNSGFFVIYSIVFKYIDIRRGTFFPASPITPQNLSSDSFLNNALEKLTEFQRIAYQEKNLQLAKQILECYKKIAIKCIEVKYLAPSYYGSMHSMLVVQYIQQFIEDGLNTKLLDIGIDGSLVHQNIGIELMKKNAQSNFQTILENLRKIAYYGVSFPRATYLISYPMQSYSHFFRVWFFNKDINFDLFPNYIYENVEKIFQLYSKLKPADSLSSSVDLQYSFGDLFDLSKSTAMPHIFDVVIQMFKNEKLEQEEKKNLNDKFFDLIENLWRFYDNLSKYAAENESFLIHFIDSNLAHISKGLLEISELAIFTKREKEKIQNSISWILSVYWRIYDYQKKISKSYEILILENLLEIGSILNGLSQKKQLNEIISTIVSIAENFLFKKEDPYGNEPINILLKGIYLCILNRSEEVRNKFFERTKQKFWKDYFKKFPENKNRIFIELEEIDPVSNRLNFPLLTFEDKIISSLEKKDILLFTEKLKNAIET